MYTQVAARVDKGTEARAFMRRRPFGKHGVHRGEAHALAQAHDYSRTHGQPKVGLHTCIGEWMASAEMETH